MTTEILVRISFDPEACRMMGAPAEQPPPSARFVFDEVLEVLQAWQRSNPFNLRDKEHLLVTLQPSGAATIDKPDVSHLADDITKAANDLLTIARLCKAKA